MTRAYTLLGRNAGYNGVLSVGRVQTPVLGLVVRRDEEIAHFVAKDYYEVRAHIVTPSGERFWAQWQPSEACEPHQDEEGVCSTARWRSMLSPGSRISLPG